MPDNEEFDNGFKAQWEMFLRHVAEDAPFPWDLWAGARGVQLAELGLRSAREGRRIEVPELERVSTRRACPTAPFTLPAPAPTSPRPGAPFTGRIAYAAAHVVADPLGGELPGAPAGARLGRHPGLPAAPVVARLRRGRGDGHRAARHGPRLPGDP